jgi:hypothetical protein
VILSHLKRLVGPTVMGLRARFLQWTKPFTSSLPLALSLVLEAHVQGSCS